MHADKEQRINEIITKGMKRNDIFKLIPERASKILEIGYGSGALLLRLMKEKNCTDIYGIEVDQKSHQKMEGLIDGNWNMYLGEDDNHLDDTFNAYFNWIIMHDVLEHMYDPWFFLSYVRRYAAPEGKLILVCPNAQYWQTIFSLLHGDFPYGLDGHFNEDHIRWFTPKSMIEMAVMSGLKIDACHLLLTSRITPPLLEFINKNKNGKLLPLPPEGINGLDFLNFFPPNITDLTKNSKIDIIFSGQGSKNYLSFLAVKIMLLCSVAEDSEEPVRLSVGSLKRRRKAFLEKTGEAIRDLLPKSWEAYIWEPG